MAKQQRRKPESTIPPDTAAPQAAGDTTAVALDRDRVAQRAYELYLARGCQEGQDLDDWLCAERELTGGQQSEQEQSRSGEQREAAAGARERELLTARDEG